MTFNHYEKIYADRHNIPVHWVQEKEELAAAAFLEWQVACKTMSVPEARRVYIKEYPKSNRLAVPRTVINVYGIKTVDKNYALGSVLNLIQPYNDSIREIKLNK